MAAKGYNKNTLLPKLQGLCAALGLDVVGDASELRAKLDDYHQKQKASAGSELSISFSKDESTLFQKIDEQAVEPSPDSLVPVIQDLQPDASNEELTHNRSLLTQDAQPTESILFKTDAEQIVEPIQPAVQSATVANQETDAERISTKGALYLQLHRANVARYFMRGAFYPNALELNQQYNENRVEDILTRYPGYLVLASGLDGNFEEDQLLIELELRNEDSLNSEVVGDLHFLNVPLPISRIRSISFATESARNSFYNNVETFKDYFFPQALSRHIEDTIPIVETELGLQPRLSAVDIPKWSKVLEHFDRVLGMFGYMKIASVLRFYSEDSVVDYPGGFSGAWHEINTAFEKPEGINTAVYKSLLLLTKPVVELGAKRRLFFNLINIIYSGEQISYKTAIELINQIGGELASRGPVGKENELDELRSASKEFIKLATPGASQYQSALKRFELSQNEQSAASNLPLTALVLLGKFSNRERANTDKQAALNHFAKPGSMLQEVDLTQHLAIMGLYYGYQSLVREVGGLFDEHPELAVKIQDENRLRFRMEKLQDRQLLESVFRFSADGGKPIDDSLGYLNFGVATVDDSSLELVEHQNAKPPQTVSLEHIPLVTAESADAASPSVTYAPTWQAAYPNGVGPDSLLYTTLMKLRPEGFVKSVAEIEALLDALPTQQRALLLELAVLTGE